MFLVKYYDFEKKKTDKKEFETEEKAIESAFDSVACFNYDKTEVFDKNNKKICVYLIENFI